MARQPTSMIGHMHVAAQKTFRIMGAPLAFVGRAAMQAAERLIPHGANEIGNALWTGNAYAPPVLHSPKPEETEGKTAQAAEAPQQAAAIQPPTPASGWGHQAPMGHKQVGFDQGAKIIDMQPQIAPSDHNLRLEAAAARIAQPRDNPRTR